MSLLPTKMLKHDLAHLSSPRSMGAFDVMAALVLRRGIVLVQVGFRARFFWQERGLIRPLHTAVCTFGMGVQKSHTKGRIKQCSTQPAIKQPTVVDTALPCFSLRQSTFRPGHCEANAALVRQLCSARHCRLRSVRSSTTTFTPFASVPLRFRSTDRLSRSLPSYSTRESVNLSCICQSKGASAFTFCVVKEAFGSRRLLFGVKGFSSCASGSPSL